MVVKEALAGGPVHYADFGGTGAPMVLIHGLGGSHLNWMAAGPRLAERHHVLAPDLIGFGWTPPAGRSAGWRSSLRAVERFVVEVVGQPVTLVGNSMGGLISIYMAARRPEWVERLVLVDPVCPNPRFAGVSAVVIAFFTLLGAPGVGAPLLRRRAQALGVEKLVDSVLASVVAEPSRLAAEIRRAHIELHRSRMATMPWIDETLIEAARSVLPIVLRRSDYLDTVARIHAPTLVVEGAEDHLVPVDAVRRVCARRPDWALRVLEGVGHVPMLEVPEEFTDVVEEWLTGLAPAKAV